MAARTRDPTVLKPGPPSFEELLARMDHALRTIDDRIELNRNPLTRVASVVALGEARYRGRVHPRALALREIVGETVKEVLFDLEGEAGLRHVRTFLALYSSGSTVAAAARKLGLSREHCSRSLKRKALMLVSERFAQLALERRRPPLPSRQTSILKAS